MLQTEIKRVTNALMVLEVAVRTITEDDIADLLRLYDSGIKAGTQQLPAYIFDTPADAMTVISALKDFKAAVARIPSYQK